VNVIYDVKHLTRKPTGWLRQHPRLAHRLKPVDGLISQKDINRARANWDAQCNEAFEYAAARHLELREVVRMHRDPFAAILPVLTHESPLKEYKKIGDEILKGMPDERRRDDRRRTMAESTSVRNYLMFRFALHLGLRQRNLRELLLCPPKQQPRDRVELEELQRGELRWNGIDRTWDVFIPAVAIKNGKGPFFRGRPFQATLPNLEGLYWWIDHYLKQHRGRLLNGCGDPGTFFVRAMWDTDNDPELTITSYYAVWKVLVQKYGIYNPYTGRGAVKGLLPHGPHAVRDVLATHLLKTTGSYELASYAIQDSIESVMKHYARFMPHEKVARAAEELNKVWRH
jgi:integrase